MSALAVAQKGLTELVLDAGQLSIEGERCYRAHLITNHFKTSVLVMHSESHDSRAVESMQEL